MDVGKYFNCNYEKVFKTKTLKDRIIIFKLGIQIMRMKFKRDIGFFAAPHKENYKAYGTSNSSYNIHRPEFIIYKPEIHMDCCRRFKEGIDVNILIHEIAESELRRLIFETTGNVDDMIDWYWNGKKFGKNGRGINAIAHIMLESIDLIKPEFTYLNFLKKLKHKRKISRD